MSDAAPLNARAQAQALAASLPPLLAEAQHLAAAHQLGAHGRRRAGQGEEFWQFRTALPGDPMRGIDWRRSSKTDGHFVRQLEWQTAQSVRFWIDDGRSMEFSGGEERPTKGARATVLGLAAAILLVRAGERVGLMRDPEPAKSGEAQINRMVAQLQFEPSADDHAIPNARELPQGSRAVFLSDFLGNWAAVELAVSRAADRGVKGALVQVLDPVEEAFPFDGRTVFESMTGAIRFETLRAKGLRTAYLERLAERKDALQALCGATGWRYQCHHTGDSAQGALMWLYGALEKVR